MPAKGLADTALKTADSGYLTRKLADVAQNVVVTMHDCGTTQGITKGVIYRGEKVEVRLADAINGRVSRQNIVNPITDEVIVRENELITAEIARKIEELGLEKIQVRSPMTCDAALGVCRLCYGMDLSTGTLVEEGHGRRHHRRPEHRRAGHAADDADLPHRRRRRHRASRRARSAPRRAASSSSPACRSSRNDEGQTIVLTRNGEISILDPKGRELEKYEVPTGAVLMVEENQEVERRRRPLPVGPAQHPDPGRSRRQGPLRGHHRRRDDARRKGPQRPRSAG